MEQIAKELTQYFLAHGLIKEDDAEVCQYALYRHISLRRGPDCSDTAWWTDYGFRFGLLLYRFVSFPP